MLIDIGIFITGLVILYFAAEALVAGSSAIALRLGIVPLIVGCTVVAFGTSAPELVVSLAAILTTGADVAGEDISVGNIIGSNIANLALILGVSSLIRPINITSNVIRREYPIMLLAAGLFVALAYDGQLSRVDGGILLVGMVAYISYMIILARRSMAAGEEVSFEELEEVDPEKSTTLRDSLKVLFGVGGLAIGAWLMVEGATSLARDFNIPELVIGISVVAIGTSLPELATSTVAAFRDEGDISIGNVIGSNVFNVLLVLGVVGALTNVGVGEMAITYDLWIMLGLTIALWPVMWSRQQIGRPEGAIMLIGYLAYMVWLYVR